ncbi:MAG: dTDP-4-dehydrorhamnose reductase [Herbaspirillum sp.]|nr:dTDP-4-dehydrorhamnose reductase [Herbaspirillum sp.]
MKILLTGQSGQIGGELALSLRRLGEVISFPRTTMDLSDPDQVRDVIRAVKPDLIVNPAAYTAVVKAESEAALAMLINGEAPGVIAQEAQRLGAAIIHYSTDYVFDGTQTQPYDEAAPTNPLNVYGKSKLAGELAIAKHCEAYWILRTSWVYNAHGNNFMKTVIRMAQEQAQFTMTADQFGAPTWAKTISRVTHELLADSKGNASEALGRIRATTGIYHLTAGGETSWYEYASFIVDHLRARGVPTRIAGSAAITPIPTAPVLPNRPKSSRLALAKLESTFKLHLPHWRSDATKCLDEIIDNSAQIRPL